MTLHPRPASPGVSTTVETDHPHVCNRGSTSRCALVNLLSCETTVCLGNDTGVHAIPAGLRPPGPAREQRETGAGPERTSTDSTVVDLRRH